ncbi:YdcF family protein [Leptolyngbya sp. PCC 6406]|uniref:YdcF family protein n=1 Tax=Leptolyngbya sp. PCC 6406 TaxID=1173264 RepID=UPI0002ACE98C|nr:YdcF family protein [Leptolyngbya sp. PCC 6406]
MRSRRAFRVWPLLILALALFWVGQSQVKAHLREPEAILVLGGSTTREHFAAEFAQEHPDLEIWVSSGSNPEYAEWLFQEAAIGRDRLRLDYQAVDTVTNFTTLVDDLEAAGIRSVYLITSDYHMRRAVIIGQIVLGSRDIAFKPVVVPSNDPDPEPLLRGMRDGARALFWVFTGRTGSSLRQSVS